MGNLLLLDQKYFQELLFEASKNHKRSGFVDRQHVRSTDGKLFFFKLGLFVLDGEYDHE